MSCAAEEPCDMTYVGCGQGAYVAETTYSYIGSGGDFAVVRPGRDFTCLITTCCLLLLLPLLLWLLCGFSSTQLYDCDAGYPHWESAWPPEQKEFCCLTFGRGCLPVTTRPATAAPTLPPTLRPTPPPTRPTSPLGPVDPFNCAVGEWPAWAPNKKSWCCHNHHLCGQPTSPPPPPDPYNCAEGFANWQVGWPAGKKAWCCQVHGKGCPDQGHGCVTLPATTSPLFDCSAGFANWQHGWSVPKKAWCCKNAGKGCRTKEGGCA